MKKTPVLLWLYLAALAWLPLSYAAHYHDDVEAFPPWQQGKNLGQLEMPATTSDDNAYRHFQTGVKLLHTYEFPEAIWSMREAQRLDPGFAMAYWGEIIASRMLVWYATNEHLGMSALQRMDANVDFSRLSPLETGFIDAARELISPNPKMLKPYEKGSPYWQFRNKMAELHQTFPDDHDVKVFYGYSILGTRRGVRDFDTNRKAIELFTSVLAENSQHPGALHYLLHATENPVQSYLGRVAAETFAKVSSASIHALHMPSHYYITLGDWQNVIDINRHALQKSQQRAIDLNLSADTWEFHGQGWVIYGLLQQGKQKEALKEINILYRAFANNPSYTVRRYLLFARAGFLVDSDIDSPEHIRVKQVSIEYEDMVSAAVGADILARAYIAWQHNNKEEMNLAIADYQQLIQNDLSGLSPPENDATFIMALQTKALNELLKGRMEYGEKMLRKSAEIEDRMIHEHGIPLVVKPANELYAEYLLQQENYGEALLYYKKALTYFPKRKSALRGQAIALSALYNAYNL